MGMYTHKCVGFKKQVSMLLLEAILFQEHYPDKHNFVVNYL